MATRSVYVIFDPAGIWECGPAIHATREHAERIVAAENAKKHVPGYLLRVEEYELHP